MFGHPLDDMLPVWQFPLLQEAEDAQGERIQRDHKQPQRLPDHKLLPVFVPLSFQDAAVLWVHQKEQSHPFVRHSSPPTWWQLQEAQPRWPEHSRRSKPTSECLCWSSLVLDSVEYEQNPPVETDVLVYGENIKINNSFWYFYSNPKLR